MAAYDEDGGNDDRAFALVISSFVTMFWRESVLSDTLGWLSGNGYEIVEVDAGSCVDVGALLDELARALDFPDYFGRNLAALDDCLGDVFAGEYGSSLDATGFVLVLRHYDSLVRRQEVAAHAVLDVVAGHCRLGALVGRRAMCLVQTDDPALELPPVGATRVGWNSAEWLTDSRTAPDGSG